MLSQFSRIVSAVVLGGCVLTSTACQLTTDLKNPSGSTDPETFNSPSAAMGQYRGALASLYSGILMETVTTAELTDEMGSATVGTSPGSVGALGTAVDARLAPEAQQPTDVSQGASLYITLHKTRALAGQAAGALVQYAPNEPVERRGHLAAALGYAELLLADVFCSGVPLSTVDYGKDYTYQPSSTTVQVYAHAITWFDSALTLAGDSAHIKNLARVGKGRALLALGQYADAATAVSGVPIDFQYATSLSTVSPVSEPFRDLSVSDREGGAGLPYRSNRDPRTTAQYRSDNQFGAQLFSPGKYPVGAVGTLVIADGVEAELIRAEAALREGDATTWLAMTNALRTDGTYTTAPRENPQTAADSAAIDTVWGFGTGRVPGLVSGVRPMIDPGTPAARLDSLFADRAAWLFLTGHRQGDLRRRVRNDRVSPNTVYPHGSYFGASGSYGNDVTLPIPFDERNNTLFKGCIDRNA